MLEVFLTVPLFVLAVALTGLARRYAIRSQILALPSSRGSHDIPTPVGGGLAIVVAYFGMLATLAAASAVEMREFVMLSASLPVAIAGWIDDRVQVSARLRLGVQIACVLCVVGLAGQVPAVMIGNVQIGGFLLSWVLLPLALVWLTNLYNFMDGIDGLAGVEAAFAGLAAAAILLGNHDYALGMLCLGLFAGSAGFLAWNWPPARIFMGDVGSGFLGLTFAIIALLSHVHGSMSLWSWVLLFACFVVDASVTLIRRVLGGKAFHEAHRQHAYQHAAKQSGNHQPVTLAVLAINICWLFPLAWLATKHPEHGVYLAAIGIVPLLAVVFRLGAGKESQ